MSKNKDKNDLDNTPNEEHNDVTDIEFEDIDEDAHTLSSVKKVRDKLKACEAEKREFLNGWQRAKADFVNLKARDEENRIASVKAAKEDVLLSVLPVLDSFELAFGNSEALESLDKNWVMGMQGIQTQLLGVLSEYGVTQTNPLGEEFDPSLHDSVELCATDSKDEHNKVLAVLQKGYTMDGKVIRAAKVTVGELQS